LRAGDANQYRFVGNGPTNHTDPTGLFSAGGALGGGLSGAGVGAGVGALVGTFIFPVVGTGIGAAAGAVAGGIIGVVAGGWFSQDVAVGLGFEQAGESNFWTEFFVGLGIGVPSGIAGGFIGPAACYLWITYAVPLIYGTGATGTAAATNPEKANELLNGFVGELQAAGQSPATAVVGYDGRTGQMVQAVSGAIPSNVNPQLMSLAQDAGGLGARTDCGNTIGRCAEFRAANDLLNMGSQLEDIRFTDAIRPRTGEIIPPCDNCLNMFFDNLFEP
jgi:hypothetical protein